VKRREEKRALVIASVEREPSDDEKTRASEEEKEARARVRESSKSNEKEKHSYPIIVNIAFASADHLLNGKSIRNLSGPPGGKREAKTSATV